MSLKNSNPREEQLWLSLDVPARRELFDYVAWQAANMELVRRLKESGEYWQIQNSPEHTPVPVRFTPS
jgi:hypothetical protein